MPILTHRHSIGEVDAPDKDFTKSLIKLDL